MTVIGKLALRVRVPAVTLTVRVADPTGVVASVLIWIVVDCESLLLSAFNQRPCRQRPKADHLCIAYLLSIAGLPSEF